MPTSLLRPAACALALSAMLATGCDRLATRPSAADRKLAARFTDVWDAVLLLRRGPIGTDAAEARGTLTLLDQAHGEESAWLHRTVTNTGAYDIDLSALSVPLRGITPVPSLVASAVSPDSLLLALLSSDDQAALVLRGVARGDSITGTWSYDARSTGGWAGDFVLTRRRR